MRLSELVESNARLQAELGVEAVPTNTVQGCSLQCAPRACTLYPLKAPCKNSISPFRLADKSKKCPVSS